MDDPQDYDATAGYDTQTGDTDAIGMANLYPQPTRIYPHQPQGQPAVPAPGQPGLNTLANQTTIQAQPRIHPIYGRQPAAQPPAPPMAQPAPPPVPPQAIPPQGTTLQATQQATQRPTGRTAVATSHQRPQRQGAATTSVILGIISIVIGALPVIGIVAVLPGALGVVAGLRGMRTRRRNAAIFGILLSIIGIALAATLVA